MDEVKKVIAAFINSEPSSISESTLINNKAIQGSVMIHRMYSVLSEKGYPILDYSNINSYGDLLRALGRIVEPTKDTIDQSTLGPGSSLEISKMAQSNEEIGIDIEFADNLLQPIDYREDSFYADNFSSKEISYCLLTKNPVLSFAGLFSVKESICKADNQFSNKGFKNIEINHDKNGKPYFEGFAISISHSNNLVVSVALKKNISNPSLHNQSTLAVKEKDASENKNLDVKVINKKENGLSISISIVALIISILGLVLIFMDKLSH